VRHIDFVTLFPEWVRTSLGHSIMGRAETSGAVAFRVINPRDYCYDPHKKVDDIPYGGHPGMLIRPEPVAVAIEHLSQEGTQRAIVITEPSGVPFNQKHAQALSKFDQITFVCGHYEGIDHRIEETFATHIFSIGDYVLTNGELPALAMADAVVRLLPGVLGNQTSLEKESFENSLLSAPNYTRPEVWRGKAIPDVLKSGHHLNIEKWEREQAIKRTKERRPDLLNEKNVSE
jgi:tRNA (guanine37-N1)-methyltransferase